MANRIDTLKELPAAMSTEAPGMSAAEAQSLLRMLQPTDQRERSFSGVMLMPALDGTSLYMRQY